MDWIPTNKVTGVSLPPVSEDEKKRLEESPHTAGKYTFAPVKAAAKPVSGPIPKEATKKEAGKVEDPTKTEG